MWFRPWTRFQAEAKGNKEMAYTAHAHDVMAAILAAMLVNQTIPVRVQLFSYVNTFFCSNKFAWLLDTSVHTLYYNVWLHEITGKSAIYQYQSQEQQKHQHRQQ